MRAHIKCSRMESRSGIDGAPAMPKSLPFFVYGTLRRGFRNHARFGAIACEPAGRSGGSESEGTGEDTSGGGCGGGGTPRVCNARLAGYVLRHFAAGYPGIYTAAGAAGDGNGSEGGMGGADSVVCGELMWARDFRSSLASCDALEEYYGEGDARNMYERIVVDVEVGAEGSVEGAGAPNSCAAYTYLCLQPVGNSVAVPPRVERSGAEDQPRQIYDWADWVRAHDVHTAGSEWVDGARHQVQSVSASMPQPTRR